MARAGDERSVPDITTVYRPMFTLRFKASAIRLIDRDWVRSCRQRLGHDREVLDTDLGERGSAPLAPPHRRGKIRTCGVWDDLCQVQYILWLLLGIGPLVAPFIPWPGWHGKRKPADRTTCWDPIFPEEFRAARPGIAWSSPLAYN